MINKILEVQNLAVFYKDNFKVLKAVEDVSFSVHAGDYLCIIGSNGSGKSSLMKAILSLVPVCKGLVSFGVKRNAVSYMSQVNEIRSDFPATVLEITLSGLQKSGKKIFFYDKSSRKNADKVLETVGLFELKNRNFSDLSTGQKQRVLLARALVSEPKIIFLDEPCASLDEEISQEFYNILSRLSKNQNISIVMISHDSLQVQRYATHVLHLERNVLFYGNIKDWLLKKQNVKCVHYSGGEIS